jgi:hypothetical protein
MKHISITNLSKSKEINSSFFLVVENEVVLFASTLKYSEASTKQEIKQHLSQVTGIEILDFSMSFSWVGGRPNDRK